MARILIAEDDKKIAQLEKDYLEINGFETNIVYEGNQVVPRLRSEEYDLVLLDVMLPGCSGYEICREIRDEIDIPILMVTARTESTDVILGLGLGADDYITKPFDPSQLVDRVRSHLKRYDRLTSFPAGKGHEKKGGRIQIRDLVIEPGNWRVWKGQRELKLPNQEFELLCFFAEHPNTVFSKEKLFESIWGYDYISDAATVSVHINRLREKIEDDARNPQIIETVWGAGYRLNQ